MTLTVAEAARLLGRTTEATRKLIERYDVEKLRVHRDAHNFRVRTADVMRVGQRSEAR